MTKDEALRLALEFIPSISPAFICEASHHKKHEQHASNEPCPHVAKQKQVYEAIKAALEAKDEKDGSPCPEFWDWLPKAYRDGDIGDLPKFTKYNMEVAFLAGKQSVALEAKDELVCVCGAVWEGQELVIAPKEEAKDEIDWKDMYEKQKRRSEMWVAKYERDIGPLEKAVPQQKAKDEEIKNDEK